MRFSASIAAALFRRRRRPCCRVATRHPLPRRERKRRERGPTQFSTRRASKARGDAEDPSRDKTEGLAKARRVRLTEMKIHTNLLTEGRIDLKEGAAENRHCCASTIVAQRAGGKVGHLRRPFDQGAYPREQRRAGKPVCANAPGAGVVRAYRSQVVTPFSPTRGWLSSPRRTTAKNPRKKMARHRFFCNGRRRAPR